MQTHLKYLLLCLILLCANTVYSIDFEHIGVKNGLSHYTIHSIYQDEQGFMWIGTRDGLNRYDGSGVTVYKQQSDDPTSLFGNNIRSVTGDKNGHLLLLCKSGAVLFDLKKEIFHTIRRRNVSCVASGNTYFWFASRDTVYSYAPNSENPLVSRLVLPDKSARIVSIHETKSNLLYVATDTDGIYVFDKNMKLQRKWDINAVVSLYGDSKLNVWICTRNDGLHKIDTLGNQKIYKHNPANPESIPANFVRTISEDDFGNYWVGLFVGLCRFDEKTETFTLHNYEKFNPQGISNSSVWSIINDSQGTLWIGTYFGGINLYNPRYSIYKLYDATSSNTNALSFPVVGRIIGADNENLWIGTDGGGLYYFNKKHQVFSPFNWGKNSSLPVHTIKSLWLDKKRNNLWIGTHLGGLQRFNLTTRAFSRFTHDPANPKSIPNNSIREIIHKNDTLYLATHNSIGIFDLKTETSSTLDFNDSNSARKELTDAWIDSKNRLWFAFSNNVYQYNLNNRELTKHRTNNNIQLFYEDSKKQLIAGTDGDGIYLFDEAKQQFVNFEVINNQLLSKHIISIQESPSHKLYISTNNGLIITDLDFKNTQTLNASNGFPLDALNENSFYITDSLDIYIGGTNGMVSFNEKDLNIPRTDYNINITGISVNNKKIKPGKTSIIPHSSSFLESITLKPQHNVLSISFSTTNYVQVLKSDILYKLEGFDHDWIDGGYQDVITYTNLNPGKYTLRLKGKNATVAGIFPEKDLTITVLPPFYKTTIAYILYFLMLIGIIFGIIRFYTSRIKLQASLDYEKKEKKYMEELNRSKLSFFTNISHEFRTPLTLIANQVEILQQIKDTPQNVSRRLSDISRNSNLLKKLVTELLDFRKYEIGNFQLKMSKNNIVAFVNGIFNSFRDLAVTKEVTYEFESSDETIMAWFDANQLEKVFYNLISNAFKYVDSKGKIAVEINKKDEKVIISVIDNGAGIPEKDIEKIFERFYQSDNKTNNPSSLTGTGIGLSLAKGIIELHKGRIFVESEVNVGSRFWVELLLGDAHISEENKLKSDEIGLASLSETEIPDEEFITEIKLSQSELNTSNSLILIIEDNKELLDTLMEVFQDIYKVITASDGIEGFEKAVEYQPDIILSDVMMPRMTGIEMTTKLKSNIETSHIPIVLLTAQTTSEQVVQGLLIGADDYVTKPFNLKMLITRCNNLVNTRKNLQKRYATQTDSDTHLIATNTLDQKLMEQATEIVERNLDNPNFNLTDFASEIYLSRTNLFNKIKGITGQTPNEFIINIRMKKSLQLLLNFPEKSIDEISMEVGFNSTSYFIKSFKKQYGITPAQYRKDKKINGL